MRCLVLALCLSCVSAPAVPTPDHPTIGCHYSCSSGRWFSRTNRICMGSLFLEDVTITGRVTTRGVDGTVLSDTYLTSGGDFAVQDTERCSCQEVMRRRTEAREPNQRGLHPGERDPLHPNQQLRKDLQ